LVRRPTPRRPTCIPRNAASGTPNFAGDTGNTAGKRTNRGFEGLAVSPDGKYAYAMLQSRHARRGRRQRQLCNRIVKFDTATGEAVAQYAYQMEAQQARARASRRWWPWATTTSSYVLERNNRGIGVGATLATADKEVYLIDLSRCGGRQRHRRSTRPCATFARRGRPRSAQDDSTWTPTRPGLQLGGKSPEKWEGLAIGPRLGQRQLYLLLAGTDNDYSVTQNGQRRAVRRQYFRFSDADPYATSIQCPLGLTSGCSGAATSVPVDGSYQLLPGVLHAYTVSAGELGNYMQPVPEPGTIALLLAGLGGLGLKTRRSARRG
jgi:hypothetical protein